MKNDRAVAVILGITILTIAFYGTYNLLKVNALATTSHIVTAIDDY